MSLLSTHKTKQKNKPNQTKNKPPAFDSNRSHWVVQIIQLGTELGPRLQWVVKSLAATLQSLESGKSSTHFPSLVPETNPTIAVWLGLFTSQSFLDYLPY